MRRVLISTMLAAIAAAGVPASAAPRCTAIATGATAGGCRYTASGPGTFAVMTASGYAVTIYRGQQVIGVSQNPGPAATAGEIPSISGDIVDIAIKRMWIRDYHNQPVLQIQDGVITANE